MDDDTPTPGARRLRSFDRHRGPSRALRAALRRESSAVPGLSLAVVHRLVAGADDDLEVQQGATC